MADKPEEPKEGEEPKPGQTPVSVCNRSCDHRVKRVKDLTGFYCKQFSTERYFSMIFSVIGVLLMIVCTVFVLFGSKMDRESIVILSGAILGSGGFISLGIASLFRFMDKVNNEVSGNL